jgi:hypothetical protein
VRLTEIFLRLFLPGAGTNPFDFNEALLTSINKRASSRLSLPNGCCSRHGPSSTEVRFFKANLQDAVPDELEFPGFPAMHFTGRRGKGLSLSFPLMGEDQEAPSGGITRRIQDS